MKIALATFAFLTALTLPAAAEDELGPAAPPSEEPVADVTEAAPPVEEPSQVAPPSATPVVVVAAPAAAPPAAAENPCGHWRGKHRMRGRLALGFSKGHLELDDEREAKQKSLIARVALRRGWE